MNIIALPARFKSIDKEICRVSNEEPLLSIVCIYKKYNVKKVRSSLGCGSGSPGPGCGSSKMIRGPKGSGSPTPIVVGTQSNFAQVRYRNIDTAVPIDKIRTQLHENSKRYKRYNFLIFLTVCNTVFNFLFIIYSVADPGRLSRIRIFSSPIPGQKDSGSRIKEFLTQKLFLISRKYDPECSSWNRIRNTDNLLLFSMHSHHYF